MIESILGPRQAIADAGKVAEIPFMVFQAGSDTVVDNSGENSFCNKIDCESFIPYPGSQHEILDETDAIRSVAMTNIVKFLNLLAGTSN